jgi:hypothetical protein
MKKIITKLLFDLIMALLWIALMIYSLTGAYWHEVLGLVLMGLFGIHIVYNMPKMKREIPRIMVSGKRTLQLRYGVDFALLFFGLFTGISGVMISKEVLTGIEAANIPLWTTLHYWAAYLTLAIIAAHVGLHMKMIVAVVGKQLKKYPSFQRITKAIWNLTIVSVILYGFIANTNIDFDSSNVASEVSEDTSAQDTITSQAPSEDESTAPSLAEYLSSLTCTACHRNCPLSAPQCGRASEQVQSAEQEYDQLYGDTVGLEINVGDTSYVSSLS